MIDKCPLCGYSPTVFLHPLSDGRLKLPFEHQKCSNINCELPCKLWLRLDEVCKTEQANHILHVIPQVSG